MKETLVAIYVLLFCTALQCQEEHTVTYILLDGWSQEIFERERTAGHLPHLEQLVSKSTYVKNGLGSFPSMTGYAYYPFITGRAAIYSDVLGLRWFDRARDQGNLRNYVGRSNVWMNQDINKEIKTVFEYFPESYTVSINSYMNRGVHTSINTGWPLTTAKYQDLPLFRLIDKLPILKDKYSYSHYEHETLIMSKAIDQLKDNPKVQWITLPGLDALHHREGMTDEYASLMHHIDALIGAFISKVEELGQSDTRMIAVISDHGVRDVNKNYNVPYLLDSLTGIKLRRGASTQLRKMTLDDPLSDLNDVDGYYVVNGNLIGYIYMKDPDKQGGAAWREQLDATDLLNYKKQINIIENLLTIEGLSFLAYRKNNSVIIQSAFGRSVVRMNAIDTLEYTVLGDDPLQLDLDSMRTSISRDEWLVRTIESPYPDGVARVYDLMMHPKMGDILLCSKAGYDFAADYEILVGNYRGGHGDLHRTLTVVPYILYIPDLEPSKIEYAKAKLVGKMVFKWLGLSAAQLD